jgi:hypothetical protein
VQLRFLLFFYYYFEKVVLAQGFLELKEAVELLAKFGGIRSAAQFRAVLLNFLRGG